MTATNPAEAVSTAESTSEMPVPPVKVPLLDLLRFADLWDKVRAAPSYRCEWIVFTNHGICSSYWCLEGFVPLLAAECIPYLGCCLVI